MSNEYIKFSTTAETFLRSIVMDMTRALAQESAAWRKESSEWRKIAADAIVVFSGRVTKSLIQEADEPTPKG